MKKLNKQATVDAQRWASAEMFYGEGAGTRRKLLDAELQTKFEQPEYYEAFMDAYNGLDMNKFAELAIKERKAIDRASKAAKNFRAIKNGNLNNLSTGLFVAVGVGVALHKTGYDKIIEKEIRVRYNRAKTEYKLWKLSRQEKTA